MQNLRERLARNLRQEQLHHHVAAAGIPPERSGNGIHANGRGVGGFFSVENLDDGRNLFVRSVAGKAVYGQPGAVAHDAPQRHSLFFREFILWNFPRAQLRVHVFVQIQLALLH